MTEQVHILSAEDYMQKYGEDGIGKGADRWMIRRQMLAAMRKEIFDLAVFRIGPKVFSDEYNPTDKEQKKLTNILDNAQKKWNRICRIFSMYKETSGLIEPEDLEKFMNDDMHAAVQMTKEEVESHEKKEGEENGSDETR